MAVIGSAYVEIRALDTKFQGDVEKAVKKIKEVTLNLRADVDLKPVREKISALRAELRNNPLKFQAEVDLKRVTESIEKVRKTHEDDALQILTEANTTPFEQSLEVMRARYSEMQTNVRASAKTALAEATLRRVARERRAEIKVGISRESQVALRQLAYTVAGAIPAEKIRASLTGIVANLESIMFRAARAATVIGAVSSAVLTLGANVLTIGGDLAQIFQIAAAGPALISAFAVGIAGMTMAWKGFGDAVGGDAKALAALPAEAQRAAVALRGVGTAISAPAKKAFWVEMNTSLQDTIKEIQPKLTAGFEKTNVAMAKMTKGALASFDQLSKSGGLDTLFNNIDKGLTAASNGMKPFFDAFGRLAVSGSKHLEAFGAGFTRLAERFNNFIIKADESGKIDEWIIRATNNLQKLGSVLGSSGSIVAGLTRISEISGGKGLQDLADGLKDIAETVNSEPFQSQLVTILRGARAGAEALGDGFGDLFSVVGEGSAVLANFLKTTGQITGKVLSSIKTMFEGTGLGTGLLEALWGLEDAITELEPGFRNLGQIIGDVGQFAGVFFRELAPGLNNLLETLAAVVDNLKDGFIVVMPVLNDFIQSFLMVAAPLVIALSDAVRVLLEGFAGLPRAIQVALLALGAFLLFKNKLFSFFDGVGKKIGEFGENNKKHFSGFREYANQIPLALENVQTRAGRLTSGISNSFAGVGFAAATTAADTSRAFRTSFDQLKGWGSSALDSLGGLYQKHLQGPLSSFRQGMANGFKQTWSQTIPWEVRDGFARIGATFENGFKSALGHTLNFADGVKREFSLLPSALRQFPGAVGEAFGYAYDQAARRMTLLGEMVRQRTAYAAAHFGTISDAFVNGPVKDIREGTQALGNHLRAMVSPVETAAMQGAQAVTRGYNNMVLAATVQGTVLKREFQQAFQTIGSEFSRVFTPVGQGAARAFSAVSDAARTAGSAIGTTFANAGNNLRASFSPVLSGIRDTLGQVGGAARTAAGHVGSLAAASGQALGSIGATAGKGLAGAASGLLGALGGPWGIAIGAATAAITVFAQAQADSKARVEEFSKSLDQQTGAVTAATEKMMTKQLFDGPTDAWDNFVRGVLENSKSVEETIDELGISTKKYADTMKDSSSRDKYIADMKKVSEGLRAGRAPSDELAASLGITNKELANMSFEDKQKMGDSLAHAATKAEDMGKEVQRAQDEVKRLAAAMGTTEYAAAIMKNNWDTLGDKTSSLSDKFRALKENLELHGNSTQKAAKEAKNYQQSLADIRDRITAFNQENKQAVTTLYEVGKGFDFTSKSGRDLHSILETQTDTILNLGTAAMDRALKGGAEAKDAQKAAIEAMSPAIEGLKSPMRDIGLSEPQITDIIKSFGLLPEDLTMALGVEGGDKARQEIFLTEMASKAFATGNYTAVLAALPEAAKKAIGEATNTADAFKTGNYDAVLEALDRTQGGKESALLNILSVTNGDYSAYLKAIDKTKIPVDSAKREIATVTGKTVEIIAADKVTGTVQLIKSALGGIERYVKVTVDTVYNKPAGAGGNAVQGANGGIMRAGQSPLSGNLPLTKMFANGGFENHVAQISRGQTPFRVWSEPETGGEAYIPLSKAKRGRSLKILEEVARMFGFSLFKQFANGGILSGFDTKAASPLRVTSNSAVVNSGPSGYGAGNTTIINQTINPSQGLSERQIGQAAITEIAWQLDH